MSRSGYSDDMDDRQLNVWRGAVLSALRGARGQAFLCELIDALAAAVEHDRAPMHEDLLAMRRRINRLDARQLGFDDRIFAEEVAAYAIEEPDICARALAVLLLLSNERTP